MTREARFSNPLSLIHALKPKSWEEFKKNYRKVAEVQDETISALDEIYGRFNTRNLNPLATKKGQSTLEKLDVENTTMSVSDAVEVTEGPLKGVWLCDHHGWVQWAIDDWS